METVSDLQRARRVRGRFIYQTRRTRIVTIDGRKYARSNLVYAHVHGRWPSRLGHRNGDRTDDRPQNLVLVANATRQRRHAKPLPLGVAKSGSRYKARASSVITSTSNIGTFDTPEQAHQAYVHEHVRIHGMQSPYYEMVYAYADCIDNGAGLKNVNEFKHWTAPCPSFFPQLEINSKNQRVARVSR